MVTAYMFLMQGSGYGYDGYNGVQFFGAASLLIGILVTILTERLIDRYMITRFVKLEKDIDGIDLGSLDYYSIIDDGDDEISDISDKINSLLKTLHVYQSQLKKSERMVTIGETATMVGHDLRNPLQVAFILNSKLKMIVKELHTLGLDGSQLQDLQYVSDKLAIETKYMNKIVSDLQDYAKKMVVSVQNTNMEMLIITLVSELNLPQNIDVAMELEAELPELKVDPNLMKRVFTNLILNAIQAMPNGGHLSIVGKTMNDYAYISVEDTGVGISAENMKNIFRPLYTTKARGIGLGLALSRLIIERHGGTLEVESIEGQGSTFLVRLPLTSEEVRQNGGQDQRTDS